MRKIKKAKGVNYDINNLWETGVEHHKKSILLYKRIALFDWEIGSDFFCFKSGGDGDNGEHLMYLFDIFFREKENQE